MAESRRVTRWLESAPRAALLGCAAASAFAAYFCMYAFRKPFAAADYEGQHFLGGPIQFKTALVLSQIVGYALSKYLGMKVCSEAGRARRAALLMGCIVTAELALVLFAVVPGDLKAVALLLNGLPLGMVWGLVVGYLEGRRASEFLLAALSCSFIVSSGVVKDVGLGALALGVSEWWMPAAVGALFLPPFALSVWLLDRLPDPTPADVAERAARPPMLGAQRRAFVGEFWPGLALLLAVYFGLTAFRDFRDNFGAEVFAQLGHGGEAAVFTRTEVPVALGVLACLGGLSLIRDNRRGLCVAYAIMSAGLALVGVATALFDRGELSGYSWMLLVGLGSYLAYVPVGSMLFERLTAYTRFAGTAVFAIYLADAVGYTGSVALQLYKDLGAPALSHLTMLRHASYTLSAGGCMLLLGSGWWFLGRGWSGPASENGADANGTS